MKRDRVSGKSRAVIAPSPYNVGRQKMLPVDDGT